MSTEERPPQFPDNPDVDNKLPMPGEPGSEKLHYRIVTVDKDSEEFGRFDKHKAKGYQVVKKQGREVMMCCDPEDFENRQKGSRKRSVDRVTEPARSAQQRHQQQGTQRPLETIDVGHDSARALYDN